MKVFSIVIVLVVVVVVVLFSRTQQSPFHCCLYRSSYLPLDSRVFKEMFPCIYCLSSCCPCSYFVYISLLLLLLSSTSSSPFHCVALSYERSFRLNVIKYVFVFKFVSKERQNKIKQLPTNKQNSSNIPSV